MPAIQQQKETEKVVEHFFRHEYGKIVAHLTRVYGTGNLEIIEDGVQDALFKAMQTWPYRVIPHKPSAWILKVARNKVIDQLRRESKSEPFTNEAVNEQLTAGIPGSDLDDELKDDQLNMFFACCHPILSGESQVILILKLLCGFSKAEIASAMLKKEDAIARALTRGKAKFKGTGIKPEVPQGHELQERINSVLKALYLLFNEGYKSAEGDTLIREDLCFEAIRLCQLMAENRQCTGPEVHALLALMCFQASRLEARTGENGELIPLAEQNRKLWNIEMISYGGAQLEKASVGQSISEYHLQASIAACHSLAPSYEATNWHQMLLLYDVLISISPSPVISLNRIVAFAKVHGAENALDELEKIDGIEQLSGYYLYYAIKGELYHEAGNMFAAKELFTKAIEFTGNLSEREFIKKKLKKLVQ